MANDDNNNQPKTSRMNVFCYSCPRHSQSWLLLINKKIQPGQAKREKNKQNLVESLPQPFFKQTNGQKYTVNRTQNDKQKSESKNCACVCFGMYCICFCRVNNTDLVLVLEYYTIKIYTTKHTIQSHQTRQQNAHLTDAPSSSSLLLLSSLSRDKNEEEKNKLVFFCHSISK